VAWTRSENKSSFSAFNAFGRFNLITQIFPFPPFGDVSTIIFLYDSFKIRDDDDDVDMDNDDDYIGEGWDKKSAQLEKYKEEENDLKLERAFDRAVAPFPNLEFLHP